MTDHEALPLSYDELVDRSQSIADVEYVLTIAKVLNEHAGDRIQNASIKIGNSGFADWDVWYDAETECWRIAWVRGVPNA